MNEKRGDQRERKREKCVDERKKGGDQKERKREMYRLTRKGNDQKEREKDRDV